MFEMHQYLKNMYQALEKKDISRLEQIGHFTETDDQYDYEDHDIREIYFMVDDYIQSGNEKSRQKAMILIDEFDTDNKIDVFSSIRT